MDIHAGFYLAQDEEGHVVQIPAFDLVLSERNLRTLLLELENEEAAVTRYTESGVLFSVRSETNEIHYANRTAGLMNAEVEEALIREELGAEDETLYLPENFGSEDN